MGCRAAARLLGGAGGRERGVQLPQRRRHRPDCEVVAQRPHRVRHAAPHRIRRRQDARCPGGGTALTS